MDRQTISAKKTVIVGLLVLVPIGALIGEFVLYRRGTNIPTARPVVIKKHNPNDVRAANQSVEAMIADWDAHMKKAMQYCDRHNLRGDERKAIIEAHRKAGLDAMAAVQRSRYTLPYDPHYPPLPND